MLLEINTLYSQQSNFYNALLCNKKKTTMFPSINGGPGILLLLHKRHITTQRKYKSVTNYLSENYGPTTEINLTGISY